MKLIELHILQSFPVSCLNRDDLGAPKTATFGGATRARLSSQCLKRAIRLYAQDLSCDLFAGERTRKAAHDLTAKLLELNPAEMMAQEISETVCHAFLSKSAPKKKKKGKDVGTTDAGETESDTSTLLYFSPAEIQRMAEAITEVKRAKPETKDFKAVSAAAVGKAAMMDAADIAIFGRMVANEGSLTLEGAGMFSHALSTHKADNDIDFWTAVDDAKEAGDDAGAANMGTIEFTSAVYYRFAALNLGMLADKHHLEAIGVEGRRKVVDTFIRAAVLAVPTARHNSMNAHTLPAHVLGIVKDKGQPIQLINAFEEPVRSTNGLLPISVERELLHLHKIKSCFNIAHALELATGFHTANPGDELEREMIPPQVDLDTFCKEIMSHVR